MHKGGGHQPQILRWAGGFVAPGGAQRLGAAGPKLGACGGDLGGEQSRLESAGAIFHLQLPSEPLRSTEPLPLPKKRWVLGGGNDGENTQRAARKVPRLASRRLLPGASTKKRGKSCCCLSAAAAASSAAGKKPPEPLPSQKTLEFDFFFVPKPVPESPPSRRNSLPRPACLRCAGLRERGRAAGCPKPRQIVSRFLEIAGLCLRIGFLGRWRCCFLEIQLASAFSMAGRGAGAHGLFPSLLPVPVPVPPGHGQDGAQC